MSAMVPDCAVENSPPLEESVSTFMEGSSAMDPKCAVEKLSASLESREPICVINTHSYECFDIPEVSRPNALVSAFNSVNIAEPSGQRDNEVKDNVTLYDASETKSYNAICSSSLSSGTRMNRLNQNTWTKTAARNCRKGANNKALLELVFLNVGRRRRSCLSRSAHSSAWRPLGNIAQVFEQNTGLDVDQNKYEKTQKDRSGWGVVKPDKNQAGRNSQGSRGKRCASTGRIRLKVKWGKDVDPSCLMDVVPVVANDHEKDWGTRIECPKSIEGVEDKLEEEVPRTSGFQFCDGGLEKTEMLSDASVVDARLADMDIIKKSAGNTADNNHGLSSQEEVEVLVATGDNRCLDPGTSPDSEVINLIPDAHISGKLPGDLHGVLSSFQECVDSGDVTSSNPLLMGSKKGKKKEKLNQEGNCCVEGGFLSPEVINNAKVFDEHGQREKMGGVSCCSEAYISTMAGNASENTTSSKGFSRKSLPQSRVADFGVSSENSKFEIPTKVDLCSRLGVGIESSEPQICEKLLPYGTPRGKKFPKSSRSKGTSESRSEVHDSVSRRGNARRQKEYQAMPIKRKVKEKGYSGQTVCKVESHPEIGNYTSDDLGETKIGNKSSTGDIHNLDMLPSGIAEQYATSQNAWVLCDDCNKWRRIPAALADSIEETNCKWTCKDNMDKDFADCSIPQEKSNAEINTELEISDASSEEDGRDAQLNSKRLGQKQSTVIQPSSWMLVKSNLFMHRSRRTQTIDEIMVCHCKPSSDGRMGCGNGCLNRILNIECVQGSCPCGKLCSNQQFEKRKYARLKWFRCGKKGYGLQLLEDISEGQFLIEYVGEVLDMHAYEARQREYALKGHKHFYFMTLNGNEVIDACAKGNLGRFINHSCDPNCRTEKWMVKGEVCIGIFALRDIKKGEEVTFDYNYVRVFGAAAKTCVCGSSQCRGYIGGDPLNTEVIVQGDSDEEYPEPVMVNADDKMDDNLENIISGTSPFDTDQTAEDLSENKDELTIPATVIGQLESIIKLQTSETLLKESDERNKATTAVGHKEITTKNEDSINRSASAASKWDISVMNGSEDQLQSSVQPIEASPQPDNLMSDTMSASQREVSVGEKSTKDSLCSFQRFEASSLTIALSKSLPDINNSKKSKPEREEDGHFLSKSGPHKKTYHSSSSVKKVKTKTNSMNIKKPTEMDSRSQLQPFKSKKLLEGSLKSHFETVQEKLNELLNSDGGISKRKDASRGYLKLLLLTAASGDSGNGETIQSNRELSMILDALLKTKSRTVLIDIINKNGLQMLHNILKQCRREFHKIPILRKLLKILEYLAVREILTLHHINGGPPHPGMESFGESILTLTEHDDKQVYQIARNFRDKWIPRHLRKPSCTKRDDNEIEFHHGINCNIFSASHQWRGEVGRPTEAIDCLNQSIHVTTAADDDCSALCGSRCVTHGTKTRKRKSRWDQPVEANPELRSHPKESRMLRIEPNMTDNGRKNTDDDVPPGFSPPFSDPLVPSNASSSICYHQENVKVPYDVVIGQPQERFISRMSVSYGIPLSVTQQFGTRRAETAESWVVAPGIPFHPFPPLPPYPRDKRSHSLCAANPMTMNQPAEKLKPDCFSPAVHLSDQNTPTTSGTGPTDAKILGENNQHNCQQVRRSYSLGRKYFRQQKWNNSEVVPPPWIRKRNGWGHMGNYP